MLQPFSRNHSLKMKNNNSKSSSLSKATQQVLKPLFSHGTPETCLKAILERPIEVLHFTSRFMKQPFFGDSITFLGTEINITKKARSLGVIMDNNLSFSSYINEIFKNSTLAIGLL